MQRQDQPSTVADPASGAGVQGGSLYVLVVGEDQMTTRPLPHKGELVIGRDPDCDLPLINERISRRHARLLVDRGEVQIEDIGSRNGIKVGGEKLERDLPVPLPIGDSLRLGPYTLIVLAARAAVSEEAVHRAAVIVRDPSGAGKTELLERIARHGVSVLIRGETGTGKEVLARTLHALSGRPGELIAINCAALNGTLLESELFGHERGAFTGATQMKPGLLELAGNGTVLLDEIGDLPLELQGKLLRALEARKVFRVGGTSPIELTARVIAASHRSLPELVARDEFREDLYFRLNGITLELLPLRERRSAIADLAHEFLAESAREAGHGQPRFTVAAMATLNAYDWPGNVRELRLVISRAVLLAGGPVVDAKHILLESSSLPPQATAAPAREAPQSKENFLAVAKTHQGNASAIARELKTSRSHVRRLANRFAIDLEALRKG